ncbi:hypothetical protein [Streptomyces gardneri]|uniref:hypothetical protein n=1 Tax=Streptomyces gardneri TaxID=66892 RepID=UPI0035D54618
MASTKDQLLTNLRDAARHLNATDKPELAKTVAGLLEDRGWVLLRMAVEDDRTAKNFPISINKVLHDRVKKASEAAGRDLTQDVVEGLRAFIDGGFSPAGYPRRGTGESGSTTMNVRLPDDLQTSFAEVAEARQAELGYKTTIGHVVKAYLAHKYTEQPAK